MANQADESTQRVFTASDYVKDGAERTVVRTSSDQDLVTLVEWIDPGKEFEAPHWAPRGCPRLCLYRRGRRGTYRKG